MERNNRPSDGGAILSFLKKEQPKEFYEIFKEFEATKKKYNKVVSQLRRKFEISKWVEEDPSHIIIIWFIRKHFPQFLEISDLNKRNNFLYLMSSSMAIGGIVGTAMQSLRDLLTPYFDILPKNLMECNSNFEIPLIKTPGPGDVYEIISKRKIGDDECYTCIINGRDKVDLRKSFIEMSSVDSGLTRAEKRYFKQMLYKFDSFMTLNSNTFVMGNKLTHTENKRITKNLNRDDFPYIVIEKQREYSHSVIDRDILRERNISVKGIPISEKNEFTEKETIHIRLENRIDCMKCLRKYIPGYGHLRELFISTQKYFLQKFRREGYVEEKSENMEANMFSMLTKANNTIDSFNDISKNGIKVDEDSVNKLSGLVERVEKSVKDSIQGLSKIEVEHKVSIKSKITDTVSSLLTSFKDLLPEDSLTRKIVFSAIISVLYMYFSINYGRFTKYYKYYLIAMFIISLIVEKYGDDFTKILVRTTVFTHVGWDVLFTLAGYNLFSEPEVNSEFSEDDMEENSDFDIKDTVHNAGRFFSSNFIGKELGVESLYEIMKKCTNFQKLINGTKFTVSFMFSAMGELMNILTSPLGIKLYKNTFSEFPEIYSVGDHFQKFQQHFEKLKPVTRADYIEFLRIVRELDSIQNRIPNHNDYNPYRQHITYLRSHQKILEQKFTEAGCFRAGAKIRPYIIYLFGMSGIGKSSLQIAILRELMPLLLEPEDLEKFEKDPDAYIANILPHAEFHENWNSTHVAAIIDDCFQQVNTSRDPKICHYNFLIRFNNSAPMEINKAFGNKGKEFNQVRICVISSNQRVLNPLYASVIDMNAVANRLDDCYDISVKKDFLKSNSSSGTTVYSLDKSKTGYRFNRSIYDISKFSMKTDAVQNPVEIDYHDQFRGGFSDLVKHSAAKFINHTIREEAMLRDLVSPNTDDSVYAHRSRDDIIYDLIHNPYKVNEGNYTTVEVSDKIKTLFDTKVDYSYRIEYFGLKNLDTIISTVYKNDIYISAIDSLKSNMKKSLNKFSTFDPILFEFYDWLPDENKKNIPLFLEAYEKFIDTAFIYVSKFDDITSLVKKIFSNSYMDFIQDSSYIVEPTILKNMYCNSRDWFYKLLAYDKEEILTTIFQSDKEYVDILRTECDQLWKWWDMEKDMSYINTVGLVVHHNLRLERAISSAIQHIKMTYFYITSLSRRYYVTFRCVYDIIKEKPFREALRESAALVRDSVKQAIVEAKDYITTSFFNYIYSGGIYQMGSIIGIFISIAPLIGLFISKMEPNSVIKIKHRSVKHKDTFRPKVSKTISKEDTQGTSAYVSEDYISRANKVWHHNLCALAVEGKVITNVLFVKGTFALINTHTLKQLEHLYELDPDLKLTIYYPTNYFVEILYRGCKAVMLPERDIGILWHKPSKGLNDFPDILEYFIPKSELSIVDKGPNCVVWYSYRQSAAKRMYTAIPVQTMCTTQPYGTDYGDYSYHGLTYRVQGQRATCMSPIWVTEDKTIPWIISMHSAGNKENVEARGHSTIVTQELISSLISQIEVEDSGLKIAPIASMGGNSDIPEQFTILREDEGLPMSDFSKFRKTPFYNCFGENSKIPSILTEYSVDVDGTCVEFEPMRQALSKYCKSSPAINDELMDIAYSMFKHKFDSNYDIKQEPPRLYTFEEAVHGCDLVGPDKRDSSCGYTLRKRGVTKQMLYGKEGKRDLDNIYAKQLREDYDKAMSMLKNGIPVELINIGFGKSELLKYVKVLEGKMRYISGAETLQILIEKSLWGHMQSAAIRSSIMNGFVGGINPYSRDWDTLAKLYRVYHLVGDGDYGNFDGNLRVYLYDKFKKFSRQYYWNGTEEEHLARDAMIWRLCNSIHLVKIRGKWYIIMWIGSLSSGAFITQLFGSFCDNLLIRYSYLMSYVRFKYDIDHLSFDLDIHEKPHIEELEYNIHVSCMSDDNLWGLREDLYGFNMQTCQKNFEQIGYVYTASDKGAVIEHPFKKIDFCQFLKRWFYYVESLDRYVAPIERDSILGALYWTENNMKDFDLNIDTQLQEMAIRHLCGLDNFYDFVKALKQAAHENGYKLKSVYLDYDVAIKFVLNTAYAPWGKPLVDRDI